MFEICWYCNTPIDVDESIEGQAQIHKECLLELSTNGAWGSFALRAQRQRSEHLAAIDLIDRRIAEREAMILATA